MKKLFIAAMALATIVSCSKDDADTVLTSKQKSVTIKIENAGTITRNGGDTAVGTPTECANESELKVWFADGSGIILEERDLDENEATDEGTYMFHQVSEQVQYIAVGRYEGQDIASCTKISDIIALAENPNAGADVKNIARPVGDIILCSDQVKLTPKTGEGSTCTETIGDETYEVPIYEASVTVAPRLSRLEITKIECNDLGYLNTATEGDEETYGFDELTLKSFTFGDNTLSAIKDEVLSGEYAMKGADGNWVKVTGDAANSVEPENGAWSWNLAGDQAFEPMQLVVVGDAQDWTVNDGQTTLTIESLKSNGAVQAGTHTDDCKCGFGTDGLLTNYKANHIYNMEISFSESNLDPRNTAICVEVTVTIADWVVVPVKPNFGTN